MSIDKYNAEVDRYNKKAEEHNNIEIPTDKLYLLVRATKECNRAIKDIEPIDWVKHRDNKIIGIFANALLGGNIDKFIGRVINDRDKCMATEQISRVEKEEETGKKK